MAENEALERALGAQQLAQQSAESSNQVLTDLSRAISRLSQQQGKFQGRLPNVRIFSGVLMTLPFFLRV